MRSLQQRAQRLAGHDLEQRAQHVGGAAVFPAAAGLVRQRQRRQRPCRIRALLRERLRDVRVSTYWRCTALLPRNSYVSPAVCRNRSCTVASRRTGCSRTLAALLHRHLLAGELRQVLRDTGSTSCSRPSSTSISAASDTSGLVIE